MWAVVTTWFTRYSSAPIAWTAVIRIGMTLGVQPAITALAAIRSTVMLPIRGMSRTITSPSVASRSGDELFDKIECRRDDWQAVG